MHSHTHREVEGLTLRMQFNQFRFHDVGCTALDDAVECFVDLVIIRESPTTPKHSLDVATMLELFVQRICAITVVIALRYRQMHRFLDERACFWHLACIDLFNLSCACE